MNVQTTEALQKALPHLSSGDADFATSMINQHARRGSLSAKQWMWVVKLTGKANTPLPAMPKVEVGSFAGVYELLQGANASLKYPKIRLQTEDGQKVVLSILGPRSKNAGNVNVTDGGSFGQGAWYGHVDGSGGWTKPTRVRNIHQVGEVLRKLAADPRQTAAAYGKLTGSCCFCGRHLEADGSMEVGYGPVCAKHYGLPWGSK